MRFLFTLMLFWSLGIFAQSNTCDLEIGTNLLGINYAQANTEQPFVDLMKMALNWRSQNNNSNTPFNTNVIDSIPKDSDGYPLYLPVNVSGQAVPQVVATTLCNGINGKYPSGTYTLFYQGTGTFSISGDGSVISSTNNEIKISVANPSNAGIVIKLLTSNINDPVKNIRVIMPGHELTYITHPFNPAFLEKIEPFTCLRFMDWMWTNNNDNVQWENRRKPSYYTQATYGAVTPRLGIAYEYIVALANLTQKDIWLNVPYMADSNYIVKMAEFFRDNLNTNIKIYIEYSNECWNPVFYSQSVWINANAPSNLYNLPLKTAYFAKRVFDSWYQVFGSSAPNRIIRVAATQMGNPWVGQQMMSYLGSSGVDAIAPAAYVDFRASHYDSLDVYGANTTISDVLRLARKSFNELKPLYKLNSQTAVNYGVREIYYEAGQHLIPESGIEQPYFQAVLDAQTDTGMYNFYQEMLEFIRDSTQSDLYMHFTLTSRKSNTIGAFGSLESIYENTSQKYQSLIDFSEECQGFVLKNEKITDDNLMLYPNPSQGQFLVSVSNGIFIETIVLHDVLGNVIMEMPFQNIIDIQHLNPGIYNLIFKSKSNYLSKKVLKL